MARRIQITPGLHASSSAKLDQAATARSLPPSTLLRLAIERRYPGAAGPPMRVDAVDETERCPDGHWIQRVTSISRESLDQVEADRKRLNLRTRVPLIRAAIEDTYPRD